MPFIGDENMGMPLFFLLRVFEPRLSWCCCKFSCDPVLEEGSLDCRAELTDPPPLPALCREFEELEFDTSPPPPAVCPIPFVCSMRR